MMTCPRPHTSPRSYRVTAKPSCEAKHQLQEVTTVTPPLCTGTHTTQPQLAMRVWGS
jgi:hypothetical protein